MVTDGWNIMENRNSGKEWGIRREKVEILCKKWVYMTIKALKCWINGRNIQKDGCGEKKVPVLRLNSVYWIQ